MENIYFIYETLMDSKSDVEHVRKMSKVGHNVETWVTEARYMQLDTHF